MSDIRFNRWLHQSGTGGVYQDSSGNVGIGTSVPTTALDVVGIVSATSFTGNLTGTASTATAAATAYGISGSPTLSGITSVSTTNLTVNGNRYPATGPLSNRNLIINGGMAVSQRGTSFSLAHDGTTVAWTLDRFRVTMSGADQWDCTVTQSSDTPVGFTSSLLITTGTAETTVDAAEYMSVQYKVEGRDLQQISSGTADAKDMILSFWIKSSQTGTFAFGIYKADQTQRGLSATYTINAADTWEQKTISIPGDTGGGGIDTDTGLGMNFYWLLAAGSDWTSTDSTSWIDYVTTGLAYGHAQNGVITNAGATWAITGVQLEVGEVATPFEHRSYGQELALCQRYYKRVLALQGFTSQTFFTSHYGTSNAINIIEAGLSNMRSSVNVSLGPVGNTGNVQYYSYGGAWTSSTLTVSTIGTYPYQQIYLYSTADGDGRGKLLRRSGASDPNIYVEISAEL